jgi:magnesium-dependent phosphatase 1
MPYSFSSSVLKQDPLLPSMIVFDLDDCLWTPEMHELPGMPEIPIHGPLKTNDANGMVMMKGVVGLQVPRYRTTVTLFDGARKVLYELATNPIYQGVVLATASSSLEPSYSYACLDGLEIVPGLTLGEMMSYNQIGRTGALSPNKISHFTLLRDESAGEIPYETMLFFDDCGYGDHCGKVTRELGVVSKRTPNGLGWKEFTEALQTYRI